MSISPVRSMMQSATFLEDWTIPLLPIRLTPTWSCWIWNGSDGISLQPLEIGGVLFPLLIVMLRYGAIYSFHRWARLKLLDVREGYLVTDKDGFVNVQIPKDLLKAATTIEIGLRDFPIILEATAKSESDGEKNVLRSRDTTGSGTSYEIWWGDGTEANTRDVSQDATWNGRFGWRMKNEDRVSEFKVSLQIPIKEGDDKFKEFDKQLMSPFYKDDNSPYHLVVFAMQWCQPVWDGISDGDNVHLGSTNKVSVVRNPDYANKNMHIVSLHYPEGHHNGIDYGTYRHAKKHAHVKEAVDVYINGIGIDPLFALHAGQASIRHDPKNKARSWTGRYVSIKFKVNENDRYMRYLHMYEIARTVSGDKYKAPNDSAVVGKQEANYIMTGLVIGLAGITGFPNTGVGPSVSNNFQAPSNMPSHCHMDGDFHDLAIMAHVDEVDEYNRFTIPNDTNHPLLIPCKCHFSDQSPSNCKFNSSHAQLCWAAIRQRCPHQNDEGQEIRNVQSKLKLLGHYKGFMDNVSKSELHNAVIAFKKAKGITPANKDRDDNFNTTLDAAVEIVAFGEGNEVLTELVTDINK
ncbi:hypothetical protein OAT16_08010 [Prolixibacteraceae bacterium]|nr:hypothetical protein [Prolixibacteraceae bacterium]